MDRKYLKRRDTVLTSAIDIFDESGINGLTTRELAKREGVTEPALYRQYGSKNDIVLTILDEYAKYDDIIAKTAIEQKLDAVSAIHYCLSSYADYYQSYPQISTIMFSFDAFRYNDAANGKMVGILRKRHEFIEQLVKKGQIEETIARHLPPSELAEVIMGMVWTFFYNWKLQEGEIDIKSKIDLKGKIESALKIILRK